MKDFQAKYELCKYLGDKFTIDFKNDEVSFHFYDENAEYKSVKCKIGKGLAISTYKVKAQKIALNLLTDYLKEKYNIEVEIKMGSYDVYILGNIFRLEDFIEKGYVEIKL